MYATRKTPDGVPVRRSRTMAAALEKPAGRHKVEALDAGEPTRGGLPGRRRHMRLLFAVTGVVAGLLAYAAPAQAAEYVVTKTTDDVAACAPGDCSLRAAVLEANLNPGADTITVPPGTYELTLTGGPGVPDPEAGDLDIVDDVTIRRQHGTVGSV